MEMMDRRSEVISGFPDIAPLAKVVILCGGEGQRWGDHLGVKKHLVPVNGKPLLQETIDSLARRQLHDVTIVGSDATHRCPGTAYFDVEAAPGADRQHKFLSSRSLWDDKAPTALLFGDVHFTKTAPDAFFAAPPGYLTILGRMTASRITGCPYGEIFGIRFDSRARDEVESLMRRARGSTPAESQLYGWQLYELAADEGATGKLKTLAGVIFLHIDDLTEDFDLPQDYDDWLASNITPKPRAKPVPIDELQRGWQRRANLAAVAGVALGAVIAALIMAVTLA